jgi:hypothetical protein
MQTAKHQILTKSFDFRRWNIRKKNHSDVILPSFYALCEKNTNKCHLGKTHIACRENANHITVP